MNNICENFRQIIINSLEDIKNLKNKTIQKSDNSFVSEGDMLVQKLITKEIKENYSNYFLISEENDHKEKWKDYNDFIVLDPIDGTDNFISGMMEWGVGISVFKNNQHIESMIFFAIILPFLDTPKKNNFFCSILSSIISRLILLILFSTSL